MRRLPAGLLKSRARLAAALVVMLMVAPPLRAADSLQQAFGKAQKAATAGKPHQAEQLLKGILHKYPSHEPSRMLLAHVYYTEGQLNKAAQHYRHIAPESVTSDFAYEYAMTFYSVKDCPRAATGFALVAPKSVEFGLANFYAGICALNARDCTRAETLLQKARGLPSTLEPARKKALARSRGASCSGAPSPAQVATAPQVVPMEQAPLPPYQPPPVYKVYPYPPPGQAPMLAASGGAPPKPVGLNYTVTPAAAVRQRTKTANYFGYKNGNSQTLDQDISASGALRYDLAPLAPGGFNPYLALGIKTEQNWAQTTGTATTYVSQSNQPGALYSQAATLPPGGSRFLLLRASPEMSYPIWPNLRAYSLANVSLVYPDDLLQKQTSYLEPLLGLDYGDQTQLVTLSVRELIVSPAKPVAAGPVALYYDYDDDLALTTYSGKVDAFVATMLRNWDNLSLQGWLNYVNMQAAPGYYVNGAATLTHFKGQAAYQLRYGVKPSLIARYSLLSNIGASIPNPSGSASDPNIAAIAASGTWEMVTARLDLAPLDWCFAALSYRYDMYTFSGIDPSVQQAFLQATPQVVTTLMVQFGLSKKF